MKKLLLTLCVGALMSLFARASNADLFTYNTDQVNQELIQLQSLEDYVSANPGITLTNLQAENNALVANLNINGNTLGGFGLSGEPPLGIPSFVWGCVLSWVGILVVYFMTDEDKEETKKAAIGCIVGGAAYVVFWILYALVWGSWWYF